MTHIMCVQSSESEHFLLRFIKSLTMSSLMSKLQSKANDVDGFLLHLNPVYVFFKYSFFQII